MSTTGNIKESVKQAEYPSPKNHQEAEAITQKAFSAKKLSFLAGLSQLSGVPHLLLWGGDQAQDPSQKADPFVHFVRYERFGFIGYLPVGDGCAA